MQTRNKIQSLSLFKQRERRKKNYLYIYSNSILLMNGARSTLCINGYETFMSPQSQDNSYVCIQFWIIKERQSKQGCNFGRQEVNCQLQFCIIVFVYVITHKFVHYTRPISSMVSFCFHLSRIKFDSQIYTSTFTSLFRQILQI